MQSDGVGWKLKKRFEQGFLATMNALINARIFADKNREDLTGVQLTIVDTLREYLGFLRALTTTAISSALA